MNGYYWSRVFTGLILIGIGGIFLASRVFGIEFDIGYLFRTYWPIILIYFGIAGMLEHRKWTGGMGGSGFWNLIYIAIGLYFLGRNLDMIHFGFGEMIMYAIPAVLILIGLQMIFRPSSAKDNGNDWDKDEWKRQKEEWKSQWKQQKEEWQKQHYEWEKHNGSKSQPASRREDWMADGQEDDIDLERLRKEPDFLKEDLNRSQEEDAIYQDHAEEELKHSSHKTSNKQHASSWKSESQWYNPGARNYGSFIGDLHLGEDVWELRDMNISHFIGDTVLDLTKAEIPYGETKLTISAFIGDIKVFVPNDMEMEVMVMSSSFLGDKTILDRHEGGLFKHSTYRLSDYDHSEKRIRIVASQFIGDLLVQRVG